ncbi:GGDEF domain-containing protein [Aliarcobacter butzleri]|uniref:EAL and GGDEF domain-containing protein n=1 Tax=Aliarcobacter butzleri TaxID=28197 RepID=A0AAP4UXS6_9BACT|nr:bifunctional diguanylate cyclase/phosphodiesterase [Aliarcobacter butzleri]MCG3707508.1 EAL and GGDEF domain-containing protein [Aliarcobacter butzleri]MCT7594302.1 EAL and GGDEF domain-containing protein [Aliarcobacter butzleri]MCT7598925.1 EAL and GGDEF domain-containing protein [Aliarcobacter butzleri]MCT7652751.1 EAL and GGDEF domain-containing protein [Aliarcobacter butzleri]MDK2090020.1 EAL and GGDEF domain-containing protein [Aliarcobacter butzleri]
MPNWTEIIEKLDYAFQPIIYSHSGKIYAVEALLRNVNEIPGLMSIDDLFDLAFNDDYLYELDLQLREKAISKFAKIKQSNLKLFYNLDNRIIYNKNYSQGNTAKILKKYNLNKDSICFELSEKGTAIEQNALSTMLQRYKESGYKIAIDDFGIGVSGLKLLYFSEAHIIKLDRFFITNIDQDSKKKLFCSSIIEMAHIMGMQVIAEGIETAKEFYTCKDIGADFIQGYLVQKPTTNIDKIEKIYKNIYSLISEDKRASQRNFIDEKFIENILPLNVNTSLYDLFLHFKENTKSHFVPITDEFGNFLGIIYESDIKKISYSQYGLSLAQNRTFSSTLLKYIKPALSVEISWGIDKILEIYNLNSNNSLGIFITSSDKYIGFINLNSLLTLSYKRNIEIATNQNPLTKLPGNNQIEKFIDKSFKKNQKDITHIIYFDFNDFKPFNDIYGFRQGDRAILIFSELLQKRYSKDSFIAHIGGDDFFVGLKNKDKEDVFELTSNVQDEFRNSAKNIYSKEDKKNGFIISKDRFNEKRRFELLSVSAAIIEINSKSDISNFDNTLNIVKKASKNSKKPIYSVL